MDGMQFGGVMMLVIIMLSIVLFIAWVVLPIALFGIKPLLRGIFSQQQRTHKLLEQMRQDIANLKPPPK